MAKNLGKLFALGALVLASLLGSQYHVNKIDDKYVEKARKRRYEAESLLNSNDPLKYCNTLKRIKVGKDQATIFAMDNPPYTMHSSPALQSQMDSLNLLYPIIKQKIDEEIDKQNKEKENK